jgi:cytochrome c peroxidase
MKTSSALALATSLAGLLGCGGPAEPPAPAPEPSAETPAAEPATAPGGPDRAALRERARAIFGVLPDEAVSQKNPVTDAKITLGRMLYFDARFSKAQQISCNTCHDLANAGVDGEPTSAGHRGQRGNRNSPTVYNAAFHVAQFWDGRAPDVEEQAKGPVLNPIEMGMPGEAQVLVVIRSIPGYAPLFRAAFPGDADPISYDNFARAIGAFERRLVTSDRFDAFLDGNDTALSDAEAEGLLAFMDTGCITCHMGPTVGGSQFQKLGLVEPYPTSDPGRYEVTRNEADRQVFKVPSLRNVEKTGPWFHDGSQTSLDDAIRAMARHQLGKQLDAAQVAAIHAFLTSLSGTADAAYVAAPELPPSGPNTPPPDPS